MVGFVSNLCYAAHDTCLGCPAKYGDMGKMEGWRREGRLAYPQIQIQHLCQGVGAWRLEHRSCWFYQCRRCCRTPDTLSSVLWSHPPTLHDLSRDNVCVQVTWSYIYIYIYTNMSVMWSYQCLMQVMWSILYPRMLRGKIYCQNKQEGHFNIMI